MTVLDQVHGGNVFDRAVKFDFSANISPLGMPPAVRKAVLASVPLWEHYPDPDCTALRKAIADHEAFPVSQIVCGNGADDLIYRIAAAFSYSTALLCDPTFGEYEKALTENGCKILRFSLLESEDFRLPPAYLDRLSASVPFAVLCTPNNPTGQMPDTELLSRIIRRCEQNGTLLLLDGCFLDLTEGGGKQLYPLLRRSCILLKAFTKSHAIPGLRLGYALCGTPELAEKIQRQGQYWSVSAPAQAAGIAALKDTGYLRQAQKLIRCERAYLSHALQNMGLHVFPSDSNFLLFRHEPGLAEALLQDGILIRSCANFHGLDERYYRIAVRTHPENEYLIQSVRRAIFG